MKVTPKDVKNSPLAFRGMWGSMRSLNHLETAIWGRIDGRHFLSANMIWHEDIDIYMLALLLSRNPISGSTPTLGRAWVPFPSVLDEKYSFWLIQLNPVKSGEKWQRRCIGKLTRIHIKPLQCVVFWPSKKAFSKVVTMWLDYRLPMNLLWIGVDVVWRWRPNDKFWWGTSLPWKATGEIRSM